MITVGAIGRYETVEFVSLREATMAELAKHLGEFQSLCYKLNKALV